MSHVKIFMLKGYPDHTVVVVRQDEFKVLLLQPSLFAEASGTSVNHESKKEEKDKKKRSFCVHLYFQQVNTVCALCSAAMVLLFWKWGVVGDYAKPEEGIGPWETKRHNFELEFLMDHCVQKWQKSRFSITWTVFSKLFDLYLKADIYYYIFLNK